MTHSGLDVFHFDYGLLGFIGAVVGGAVVGIIFLLLIKCVRVYMKQMEAGRQLHS